MQRTIVPLLAAMVAAQVMVLASTGAAFISRLERAASAPQMSAVQIATRANVEQEACELSEPEPYVEMVTYDVPLPEELQQYTAEMCSLYDVPQELAYAVMQVESGYTVDARSSTDDYGLMQINSVNAEWLKNELEVTDLLDARQNITAGCYMLGMYLDKYDGDTNRALMAYNLGAGGAERAWKQGTRYTTYTNKVTAAMLEILKG